MFYKNESDKPVELSFATHPGGMPLKLRAQPGEVIEGPGGSYVEAIRRESVGALVAVGETKPKGGAKPSGDKPPEGEGGDKPPEGSGVTIGGKATKK